MRSYHLAAATAICFAACSQAYDQLLGWNDVPIVENRTIDEIYQAALAEGGVVTLWHGGDSPDLDNGLKAAFEKRFPGMTLNVTVDFSKYQGARLDRQLAVNDVYVDSIMSQSLQDFPRWADENALLRYQPLYYDSIHPAYKDKNANYYGVQVVTWNFVWNGQKSNSVIRGFEDFLKPEYKDKLVLTYPNDDDAVLSQFDLIMQRQGLAWFDALLEQNPRWVRGISTPPIFIGASNTSYVATFTSTVGLSPHSPLNISFPTDPEEGQLLSWALQGAILRNAPHPEGAKLLHAYYLSDEFQEMSGTFSSRTDVTVPNQPFDPSNSNITDPTAFERFNSDRARVERLRVYFEDRLGPAVAPDPITTQIIP